MGVKAAAEDPSALQFFLAVLTQNLSHLPGCSSDLPTQATHICFPIV